MSHLFCLVTENDSSKHLLWLSSSYSLSFDHLSCYGFLLLCYLGTSPPKPILGFNVLILCTCLKVLLLLVADFSGTALTSDIGKSW